MSNGKNTKSNGKNKSVEQKSDVKNRENLSVSKNKPEDEIKQQKKQETDSSVKKMEQQQKNEVEKTPTSKKAKAENVKKPKTDVAKSVPEVNLAVQKKKNFIKIFTIAFVAFDIVFMLFFFTTLTLLVTHTIVWSKVYTIITFAVIIANLPFLIYMLVSMLKTTNRYS